MDRMTLFSNFMDRQDDSSNFMDRQDAHPTFHQDDCYLIESFSSIIFRYNL